MDSDEVACAWQAKHITLNRTGTGAAYTGKRPHVFMPF
jgi:hypothetical protein